MQPATAGLHVEQRPHRVFTAPGGKEGGEEACGLGQAHAVSGFGFRGAHLHVVSDGRVAHQRRPHRLPLHVRVEGSAFWLLSSELGINKTGKARFRP